MQYSLSKISQVTGGELMVNTSTENCHLLYTDTRSIVNSSPRAVFFALNGKNRSGFRFIGDAWSKGIRNFICDEKDIREKLDPEIFKSSNFLLVDDCLTALQQLAVHHRTRFDIPVVAVTGSNGKTIVKEWLYQLLYRDKNIHRSPKSYNSQLGVPLSVLGLNENHNLAVFEAGISEPGEMEKLEKIIQPQTGILTNIGSAHQENFHTVGEKILQKLLLFKNSDILIYRKDYRELDQIIRKQLNDGFFKKEIKLFSWSTAGDAAFKINSIVKTKYDTRLSVVHEGNEFEVTIGFTDDASIENAIHCLVYLVINGYTQKDIPGMMKHLSPVEMRMELKEGLNNCTLINDTYNSDIYSLSIALDFLNRQNQHPVKTLILSDILQSGRDEKSLYAEVADILKSKNTDRLIGIGPAISRNAGAFETGSKFYGSTDEFINDPAALKFENEAILIKGARSFEFEKITMLLQKKVHATILEMNFQSLIHNLRVYRSFLKPETKIMAMVKAFSYGSGSHEIAGILQFHGVDYLAVAYTDEGVDLRIKGITMPIMIMNPDRESLPVILNNNLEPEIYSMKLLKDLIGFVHSNPKMGSVPVHLKIDTGMHRLGFDPGELDEVADLVVSHPVIRVKSIFSHLAASDSIDDDVFTRTQIINFKKLSDRVMEKLGYPVIRHILNSTGIVRFPYAQFEMVRLGLGLYGIDSSAIIQDKLENISTFKTSVSQVRHVRAGDSVGYGTHAVMKKDSTIAVIGVGYADGFSRGMGNGNGTVMIRGKEVPVVGSVCMDMTMVDVTDMDVAEGDEVLIFGRELPVTVMAKKLNTIPYEILTSVSQRVKRIYYKD